MAAVAGGGIEPGRMRRERKVVTALFADLVGSTALTAALDPEDAMDVVGGAISAVVLVVEELGGTVKDLAGDGVLALFGAPVAHEDDPERAVRAGLRIVEAVAGAAAEHRLDVRVGIETGLVVLGPVGAGSRVEYGATGDAVNTAARLQAEAEPGTVLVSAATQRLVHDRFTWSAPRDLVLKGKDEPVTAVTALAAASDLPVLRTYDQPVVGRDEEVALLTDAVDAALAGTPGLVVVVGDGGLGKSRLLDEARTHGNAQRPFFNWLTLRCQSYEQTVPFAPLRRLLEGWLGVDASTPPEEVRAVAHAGFAELLAGGGATDAELEAGVGLVLGLPGVGATDADAPAFRVASAIEAVLARLLAHAPVVVAVEDVQWADRRTLELVDHLVDRVEELGVLLLVTGRPVAGHAIERWADLAASDLRPNSATLVLRPLDGASAEAHLASLVGASTLPIDLERSILATAEGNPYFVEELVRALVDAGALVPTAHGPVLDPAVAFEVPPTIERVVLERLDRLPDDLRRIVSAAAVVGRTFDLDLVGRLLASAGAPGDADGATPSVAVKELARLGLVEPAGEPAWRFTHAVVHDAALHGMLRKDVRDLHRRLATLLDAEPARATAGGRAVHWFEAGDPARALPLAVTAADEADAAGATDEAVAQLDLAVRAAEQSGAPGVALLLRLADAQRRASRLDDALATFGRAAEAARAAGDREALADAAVGFEDTLFATRRPREDDDPAVALLTAAAEALGDEVTGRRVQVLAALGRALAFSPGGRAEARAMAAGAVTLSRAVDDPCAAAYALSAWRTGELAPDRLELRLRHDAEAVTAADRAGDPELWIEAARARFVDLLMAGRRDEADEVLDELRRRITAAGQPFHLWYLAMWDVQAAILDGDLERAEAGAGAFRRQGRRLRYGDVDQVHAFQQLLVLREQGRAAEVLPAFERLASLAPGGSGRFPAMVAVTLAEMGDERAAAALRPLADDGYATLPDDQARGALLALLAEAVVRVGRSSDATTLAPLLAPWAGQVLVVGSGAACLGSADHYLGLLAAFVGDGERAGRHLAFAEDVHTRLRAPLLLARTRAARSSLVG
jgi:class 3 adenylate cyclase